MSARRQAFGGAGVSVCMAHRHRSPSRTQVDESSISSVEVSDLPLGAVVCLTPVLLTCMGVGLVALFR